MSTARPSNSTAADDPAARVAASRGVRDVLRDNGLSIVTFGLFAVFLVAQTVAGWHEYMQEAREHGRAALSYLTYVVSGHCLEAVFENWESEFLQMAAYVGLTSFLYQRGSAESKKIDEENPQDADPNQERDRRGAPGPVKRGGLTLWIYERSLSLALGLFFLLSFAGHAIAGAREYSEEQVVHGEQAVSVLQYMGTSRFWFESFQNWQSEFLAVFALVTLSIFLRERGSPESKPVAAPHSQTGCD